MNKYFLIVGTMIVVVVVFTTTSIIGSGESVDPDIINATFTASDGAAQSKTTGATSQPNSKLVKESQSTDGIMSNTQDEIPFNITLLGLVFSKEVDRSYAELAIDAQSGIYKVDDNIKQLSVYLKSIDKLGVVLEYESRDYRLNLGAANSMEDQQLKESFSAMTADEIGARPRQIEHIVSLLPNNFNDGGKVIIPGVNPSLFKAARFKEGDVLLEVNGFNLDDEDAFNDMQRDIRNAQMLTFKVNRAGRIITLYLDIPHETLKF